MNKYICEKDLYRLNIVEFVNNKCKLIETERRINK